MLGPFFLGRPLSESGDSNADEAAQVSLRVSPGEWSSAGPAFAGQIGLFGIRCRARLGLEGLTHVRLDCDRVVFQSREVVLVVSLVRLSSRIGRFSGEGLGRVL